MTKMLGQRAPAADLNLAQVRRRLSPSGLKGFFKMADLWRLSTGDARQLLDVDTAESYEAMKHDPETRILSVDQMYRLSCLIGIFKALNIANGADLANRWIRLPNTGIIFGGVSPIDYMIKGGAPAMRTVRRLLDAGVQGR